MARLRKEQAHEAERVAVELKRLGIRAIKDGEWIKYEPAPPPELVMRLMDIDVRYIEEACTAQSIFSGGSDAKT